MSTVTVEKTKNYLVVRIPLGAVQGGRAKLSPRAQKIVDASIAGGLGDIKAGRVFGPFKNMGEFKRALRHPPSRK